MKDFSYYSTPTARFYGYDDAKELRAKLEAEINSAKMTASERSEALLNVKRQVRERIASLNAKYNEQALGLEAEFWRDARKELGYADMLDSEGVEALERKAWTDGRSSGLANVYCHLEELTTFVRDILAHAKEAT